MSSVVQVDSYLKLQLADEPDEWFGVMFLTSQHRLIRFEKLFRGTVNASYVHIRVIARKALREEIAKHLGKSIDEVKGLLTAYANGSQKKVGNSNKLKDFFEESDQLRREVIVTIAEHEPELLQCAIKQSKNDFPEDTDWQSIEKRHWTAITRQGKCILLHMDIL